MTQRLIRVLGPPGGMRFNRIFNFSRPLKDVMFVLKNSEIAKYQALFANAEKTLLRK